MKTSALIAAIVTVALTLALNALVPPPEIFSPQKERIGKLIPENIGGWKMIRDLPVLEVEMNVLGTDDILHRLYELPGSRTEVLLSLVFSTGARHSMHPPEVCLQAGGYTLASRSTVSLPQKVNATVLNMVREGDNQLVNYWFLSNGRETASYIMHQLHLVMNQILFQAQPSILIRISTGIANQDQEAAQKSLAEFSDAAIPVLRQNLSSRSE